MNRRGPGATCPCDASACASLAIGFLDVMARVDGRMIDRLHRARWPANDDAIDGRHRAQTEVQRMLILRAETGGRCHFLRLDVTAPLQLDAGADGAAIAASALEIELHPVTIGVDVVLI